MFRPLRRVRTRKGFTLLEVMVAMAILGLALTAIFSSEAGAIRMATRTGKMGTAALMARCKMLEVEEHVAREGLPAVFANGSDDCCEDAEIDGFTCEWEINPVILPDTMFAPEEEEGEEGEGGEDPLAGGPLGNMGIPLSGDPTELLSGMGGGGIGAMAMQQVYPILKPAFEAQIRRATVTVHWKEGSADKSFDVTQYLVAENGVPPTIDDLQNAGAATGTATGATQ